MKEKINEKDCYYYSCNNFFSINFITQAAAFSAQLKEVKYYKSGCDEGKILVREYYNVSGIDLNDLVYTRIDEKGEPYSEAVKFVTAEGLIIQGFCAVPNFKHNYKIKFMSKNNKEQSDPITYKCDTSEGNSKQR